jgi:hypothetical protein
MIEEVYAWVGVEQTSGEWGIICAHMGEPFNTAVPLVVAKRSVAEKLERVVRDSFGHTQIKLVRYTKAEIVKELKR